MHQCTHTYVCNAYLSVTEIKKNAREKIDALILKAKTVQQKGEMEERKETTV